MGGAMGGQQGCNCGGTGMKPTQGTTPPGQPPVSMRPNDAIPYPGTPSMRPFSGSMPQIMPEYRHNYAGGSLFSGGYTPNVQPQQQQQTFASLFDMVRGRMF